MAGIIHSALEQYKCDANDVLKFKLVREVADIENNEGFRPEMCHQVFGDQESIFGYKELCIQMYYTAARLYTYLNITYTSKVAPEKNDGLKPDDVIGALSKEIPPGYYTSIDDFSAAVAKDATFKPFGELLHTYTVGKEGREKQFEIYRTDLSCPGFRDYHSRLQTFILFFIDAASYIDVDDDRWSFYLVFEKYKKDGSVMYATVGYMTVYSYYAYPSRVRPRISQVLVLPPFQKQGHGAQLLQTFYNRCYGDNEILDITVEDPSEDFQRLRDFVDAKNCMALKSFKPEKLRNGFDEDMVRDARTKLKVNRRQIRRVYEILRMKATDHTNKKEYSEFRLDVKRRLNIPFQKNGRDFDKLQKALAPDELSATLSCMTLAQRHQYLEKAFEEQTEVYSRVIERLNMC